MAELQLPGRPPWGGLHGIGTPAGGTHGLDTWERYAVALDPARVAPGTKLRVWPNPYGDPSIIFTAVAGPAGQGLDFYDHRGRLAQLFGALKVQLELLHSG